jgi:hypothetical protein
MKKILLTGMATMLIGLTSFGAAVVWVEGESAVKHNLSVNNWVKGDNPALLSGGDMLPCINDKQNPLPKPGYVVWKLDVPEDGDYQVYFRHGYTGHLGQMRYRFIKLGPDGAPLAKPGPEEAWIQFDNDAKVMDQQSIGQHRSIEWTRQAPVKLEKGSYYLDLQVTGPGPGHINDGLIWTCIDVICLTKDPFTPSGFTKPGESPAATPAVN